MGSLGGLIALRDGAGTRMLLEHELRGRGVDASAIPATPARSTPTWPVAAAVATGRADAGLGIRAAAGLGLDFVPVAHEPYHLVVAADAWDGPLLAPLRALLDEPGFRSLVEGLGGYSCAETGLRVR